MSPELFKCFINDLSEKLNKIPDNIAVPLLDKAKVSHLLWADDLVLLALDAQSLQHMLNILHIFPIPHAMHVLHLLHVLFILHVLQRLPAYAV